MRWDWRSKLLLASTSCPSAADNAAVADRSAFSSSTGSSVASTSSGATRSPTLANRFKMRPPMRKASDTSFSARICPVRTTVSPTSPLPAVIVRTGRGGVSVTVFSCLQAPSTRASAATSGKTDASRRPGVSTVLERPIAVLKPNLKDGTQGPAAFCLGAIKHRLAPAPRSRIAATRALFQPAMSGIGSSGTLDLCSPRGRLNIGVRAAIW